MTLHLSCLVGHGANRACVSGVDGLNDENAGQWRRLANVCCSVDAPSI